MFLFLLNLELDYISKLLLVIDVFSIAGSFSQMILSHRQRALSLYTRRNHVCFQESQ